MLGILIFMSISTFANAQKFNEYEVKAVYLYQFAKFVTWPPLVDIDNENFVVGIYGNNPFKDFSDVIYKDKLFKGKNCKIVQVKTPEDARACQMLFFSGVDKYSVLKFIASIKNQPVLLIGDNIEDFCQIGGMINFTHKDSKYRFQINPDAAKHASVQISSKLFAIAELIQSQEDTF
jgi:hypothetical protein